MFSRKKVMASQKSPYIISSEHNISISKTIFFLLGEIKEMAASLSLKA